LRYYELFSNLHVRGRWYLRGPVDARGQEVDPWQFDKGRTLDIQETLILPVSRPGRALDFTLTGLAIPVVSSPVVALFERLGIQHQVQFIPASIDKQPGQYFILNVLRIIRCIDDARCEEVRYWKPEDGQPDKVGQYHVVTGLRIDPSQVGDAHIFRPWGWGAGVLLVSGLLKDAMEQEGLTGLQFTEV